MSLPDVRIETERLLLRPPQMEDFEAFALNMADDEAMRFIGGGKPRIVAWRAFMSKAGAWAIQGFSMFSVIEKSSGRWIGQLGPTLPDGWPGREIGWGLARETWGKGYAYEGTVASVDWVFEHLRWRDMIHSIHPDNASSQALARRLGSVCEGAGKLPPPDEDAPIEIWRQTREQWLARQRR